MHILCTATVSGAEAVHSNAEIVTGLQVVGVRLVVMYTAAKRMILWPLYDCRR